MMERVNSKLSLETSPGIPKMNKLSSDIVKQKVVLCRATLKAPIADEEAIKIGEYTDHEEDIDLLVHLMKLLSTSVMVHAYAHGVLLVNHVRAYERLLSKYGPKVGMRSERYHSESQITMARIICSGNELESIEFKEKWLALIAKARELDPDHPEIMIDYAMGEYFRLMAANEDMTEVVTLLRSAEGHIGHKAEVDMYKRKFAIDLD